MNELTIEDRHSVRLITLNKCAVLNALSYEMINQLYSAIGEANEDEAITAIIVKSDCERAFCAGGDIKAIYDNGPARRGDSSQFFWAEYRLNRRIYNCKKPYISLLNGITMGGGVGISVHGKYRIATEQLKFAMPETGIGFFPDVGGSYFLSRLPGKLGYYLGLTGARLGQADAHYAGVATHTVPSQKLDELLDKLLTLPNEVDELLSALHEIPTPGELTVNRDAIDKAFSGDSVEKIIENLAAMDSPWAKDCLVTLKTKSPTSLKVTLRQLQRGEKLAFDACMQMEYGIANQFLSQPDFYEGVRAVIIDKDNQPRWTPATLEEVTDAQVDAYFDTSDIEPLHFDHHA